MIETDNLTSLKDDMIAFIEGHGIRHFPALIPEDAPRVWWKGPAGPDGWKDFVEMAKAVNAPLMILGEDRLEKLTLEMLLEEMEDLVSEVGEEDAVAGADQDQARRLLQHVGKIGHIELAFAHQGFLFAHETLTDWYREYRYLVQAIDSMQDALDIAEEDE